MILKEVKPLKQKKRMCGPASLEIVLRYYGKNKNQNELKKMLGSSILMGTTNSSMIEISKKLGFKVQFKTNSSIEEIRKLISNKIPPIIGWITPRGGSHYSVVQGIDKKYIFIVDPELNKVRKFKIEDFSKRWLDVNWEKLSFLKKVFVSIKIFIKNKISKKENFNLPLKKEDIVFRELIVIKK